ncbi:MAG: hypothetical protein H0W72_16995, partial [Planctomycetes bacterium]|nr:hypothetical protein [Planctomycetota bacterium]
ACVVWRTPTGVRRADPVAGLLVADNGARSDDGKACGERACRLAELAQQQPAEFTWLRRCMTATYLASLNAQAMCFEPSTRRCELAIGGALRPASRQRWTAIDLAPLFTGGAPLPVLAQDLGRPEPLAHYTGEP